MLIQATKNRAFVEICENRFAVAEGEVCAVVMTPYPMNGEWFVGFSDGSIDSMRGARLGKVLERKVVE